MANRPKTNSRKLTAAILFLLAASLLTAAHATTPQKKQSARAQFEKAETAREALEAKPAAYRKIADYEAVLKLYNSIPVMAPTIHQAPDSIFQAAKLNQQIAEAFPRDAAKYRAEAKRLFQTLLKEYPTNRYRKETNQALAIMDTAEEERAATHRKAPAATAASTPPPTLTPVLSAPASAPNTPATAPNNNKLVVVSNIREWSTPSYTRVVIDVEDEVQFEAGRIANPDRIYFDLHNTKLVPALKDRTRDVEDGLLKKIRLGVNRAGITRVVLEVGQITTYSAFLLPNPYRLVIDIQGAAKPVNVVSGSAPPAPAPAPAPLTVADPIPIAAGVPAPPPAPTPTVANKPKRKVTAPGPPTQTQAESTPVETAKLDPKPDLKPDSKLDSKLDAKLDPKPDPQEIPSTNGPTTEPVFEKVPPVASSSKSKSTPATGTVLAPSPTSNGQRSLTRALGLKIGRIVIDAGHGGHDTGTIGPSGYCEKDLVLDVALRLGEMVEQRLGSEVVYTRNDDTFIPLEMRTAIANQKQADLFVSVHANASRDAKARGVETYYLSFSTSQDALEVAARENAVSEKSIHELQDLVKKITLYEKVEESKEFAGDVQKSMYTGLSRGNVGLHNRGVKKAPFVVLIGANMPSILAEISFVSNPQDEKQLKKPEYRQKIAESLFRGIQHYANSLGGVKVASQRGDAPFE